MWCVMRDNAYMSDRECENKGGIDVASSILVLTENITYICGGKPMKHLAYLHA